MSFFVLLTGCLESSTLSDEEKVLPSTAQVNFERSIVDIDYDQSYIAFTGTKNSFSASHQGEFEKYTVQIALDEAEPTNLEKADVTVAIDITSLITENNSVTGHLLESDYFDTETFPMATFVSTSLKNIGDQEYEMSGDLMIKEVSKSVTFTANITNDYAVFKHELNRLDFGIGEENHVDVPVPLEVKLVFKNA